jgi:uncharacterized protein (TIGR02231 family)
MPNRILCCTFVASGITLIAAGAPAAEIPGALHVDKVTVYVQGAMVTRSGTVNVPAGSNRLVIAGLPAAIDARTLRLSVDDAAVRLGEIEVRRVNAVDFASAAERNLRRRLEQSNDRRTALEDGAATAQLQLKLLESVAANPTGDARKAAFTPGDLGAVLGVVGSGAASARRRLREAAAQLRTVDREIETLKADLAKIATPSRETTTVVASVDAATGGAAGFSVSYAVADAGWHWIYAARLDTEKRRVTLQRQGQVRQGTGEDWNDVELTLSTMPPSDDAATPGLASEFLNLRDPRQLARAQVSADKAAPAAFAGALAAPVAAVAGEPSFGARLTATQYSAEYAIRERVTLRADREPRLYPIGADTYDVALTARVIPRADHRAHLEATFKYPGEAPVDAGELQLYRDGAFVGQAPIAAMLPQAQVRMPFGPDDRVRVAVHDEPARSGVRGLLGRQTVRESRRRFDVTSFHATTIDVEIIDRIPVSQDADVHVELSSGATAPTSRDLDGRSGVLSWRFAAEPAKTVSVRHYYSVTYPGDRELVDTQDAQDGQ